MRWRRLQRGRRHHSPCPRGDGGTWYSYTKFGSFLVLSPHPPVPPLPVGAGGIQRRRGAAAKLMMHSKAIERNILHLKGVVCRGTAGRAPTGTESVSGCEETKPECPAPTAPPRQSGACLPQWSCCSARRRAADSPAHQTPRQTPPPHAPAPAGSWQAPGCWRMWCRCCPADD